MTAASDHYERLLAEQYTWMLGGDITALAADQARLLRDLGVGPSAASATAVDLGAGPGNQTLALAELGFAPVFAVDTSRALLDELAANARDVPSVRPVQADIRGAVPGLVEPGGAAAVVCMGDTLTHLPGKADVLALLGHVADALAPGGHFVVTYRDLTPELRGTDRFLAVRGDEERVLTCFLEYLDEDRVMVHDLLNVRTDGAWRLSAGAYPKLRIPSSWLVERCRAAGLDIAGDAEGPRGMRIVHAVKS